VVTKQTRDYVMNQLNLKKDAAEYVNTAPPEKLNYLTPEASQKYGIEFERRFLPKSPQ
jgi:hypothetical protein